MATKKKKTVWITKYALTRGIFEAEVIPATDSPAIDEELRAKWVRVVSAHGLNGAASYRKGIHAFETKQEAVVAAEHNRADKVKSLEKQLRRLKALKFS